MEYRIATDNALPPIYWVEKLDAGEWVRVFGTTEFSAGEAWGKMDVISANEAARVTQEELAVLFKDCVAFSCRRSVRRLESVVWSEAERQARCAFQNRR